MNRPVLVTVIGPLDVVVTVLLHVSALPEKTIPVEVLVVVGPLRRVVPDPDN